MRPLRAVRFALEKNLKRLLRVTVRFVVVWGIEAFCLLVLHWLVPGIGFSAPSGAGLAATALSAALVIALLNTLVRPLAVWLLVPLNVYSAGFFTFFINAGVLVLASYLLPYFTVATWGAALIGALVLAAVNTVLTSLTTIDDDYSFFDGVVQWLSRREVEGELEDTRGLVILEIDGLGYQRMAEALRRGLMPRLQGLITAGSHRLSPYFTGLPSQTSSSQAAIMYGDAYDIPAFRWYEKEDDRLMVSGSPRDAREIDRRHSTGRGLLRGGTSINNSLSGDARKALLTMSAISPEDGLPMCRWLGDLNLFFINPYLFPRTIILMVGDMLRELSQAVRQLALRRTPRLNRFGVWLFQRAVMNVYLREMTTFLAISEILRGSPAIYASYPGYDEVAHKVGPRSGDALSTLRGIDRQLGRVLDVLRRKAPRPYDFVVLSDHGQSEGATFRQRFGVSLAEFIEGLAARRVVVNSPAGTSLGSRRGAEVTALLEELEMLSRETSRASRETKRRERFRAAAYGRASGFAAARSGRERDAGEALHRDNEEHLGHAGAPTGASTGDSTSEVVVCAGGNMAHVYFREIPGRATLGALGTAHPGLVEEIISHPGVGFVVALAADGGHVVMGKAGVRDLETGGVVGSDPLSAYRRVETAACRLLRLAAYPHSGDLIINGTLFPDGTVAAFEEQIGSHGGLGGEQTNAFILHPADLTAPIVTDAAELFPLLDARRELTGPPPRPEGGRPEVDSWSFQNLWGGIRDIRWWAGLAARVFTLRPRVFREVADERRGTGPALVLLLLTVALSGLTNAFDPAVSGSFLVKFANALWAGIAGWMVAVLLAYWAGRLLQGRGSFTRALRALTFARVPLLLAPLQLMPVVGRPLFAASILLFVAASLVALREAMSLRWVLALLIPVVGVVVLVVGVALVGEIFSGVRLTVAAVLYRLGLAAAP